MGDFNINLLAVETYDYAHKFLLSLQSYSLIPTVDKPTRVYNNSATLIDNIFALTSVIAKLKVGTSYLTLATTIHNSVLFMASR